MNTNQYFSFSRLGMVMKRDWMENWKTNLYVFLGIFLVFLAVYLFNMADFNNPYVEARKEVIHYINPHTASFVGVTLFLFFYFAAEIMRNMRTKEARLSYLMLPATLLEKFVSRALYVIIGVFVMVVTASLLAEAVHWAFMPFFDELPDKFKVCVWPEAWGNFWETINPFKTRVVYLNVVEGTDPSTWQRVERSMFFIYLMGYMASFWQHSIFILGGNYFGKHPFLKTIGTMILIGILIGWIADSIDWSDDWIEQIIRNNVGWLTEEMVAGFISFIFFVFTALNWWLSYKLFTRRQVIEPKFRL